tara:strand:- start:75 stop:1085 length:1011 start_codon:yes stop_codon:yes gene_type:complete
MTELKELLITKRRQQRWLIKNLIGMGEIAVMYAPKDHHKTGMALKIAMEIATGSKELGVSQSGKVLYYALDNPNEVEMLSRAIALAENSYPDHSDLIGSNLHISWEELNLTRTNYEDDVDEDFDGNSIDLTWYRIGELWCDIDFYGYSLVIVDTLSKALVGGGVNDDAIIRKVISNLRQIINGAKNNLSILLIHHSGKDARKGMMGTSVLSNDISTVLKIKKKKDGYELLREKHKSPLHGKSIPFKSRSVVINHQGELHDSIYVDIGSGLDEFSAEIVSQFNLGLSKKEIKGNTMLLGLGNTTTDKSFGVVFNRRWKNLIDTGFINERKQETKHDV